MKPCCKVGASPNRSKYEKSRLQGMTFKQLEDLSHQLGENIGHTTFHLHFSKHMKKYWDTLDVDPEPYFRDISRRKIINVLNIFDEIETNLNILRDLANKMRIKASEKLDTNTVNIIIRLMEEIRKTSDFILDSLTKYGSLRGITKEKLFKALTNVLKDEPKDKQIQILEKLKHELEEF